MGRKQKFWIESKGVIGVTAIIVVLLLAIIRLYFQNTSLKHKIEILKLELRITRELTDILKETRHRYFDLLSNQVMEEEVPICQIISPLPPKPPGKKVERLEIRLPAQGLKVSAPFYVEGLLPDPGASLFVIFHSIASADYQIQPKVTVCEDNIWRVRISLKEMVGISVGSVFEIMAVANPKVELKEGDALSGWPEAQWRSQVIEVIRK